MKLIVIQEQPQAGIFRYTFRATVPSTRQPYYAGKQATAVSAYQDSDGPTQASDQTALRAGQITEQSGSVSIAGRTLAQAEADLQALQATFQADVNAGPPWIGQRYGSSWDGTTWTVMNVS